LVDVGGSEVPLTPMDVDGLRTGHVQYINEKLCGQLESEYYAPYDN